ncbi:MAG: hypothetical protein JWM40_2207 [Frankiales bacterium]|nr:hypothetical protein [Frankiales bacterium]
MRLTRPLIALAVAGGLAAGAGFSQAAVTGGPTPWALDQSLAKDTVIPAPLASPGTQDRYAPAGGCFALKSANSGKLVGRSGRGFAAAASTGEAFRFQAMDLGKYLLFGSARDFLATAANPAPIREVGTLVRGYEQGTGDEREAALRGPVDTALDTGISAVETATAPLVAQLRGDHIRSAYQPSASAEWVLKQVGSRFVLQQAYDDGDIADPGALDPPISATLVSDVTGVLTAGTGAITSKAAQFELVKTAGCASWPTAPIGVTGPVLKGATSFSATRGYEEAHMHMMAFEFIGGRAHCGRPWHPYGIAYALVDCPDHSPGGYGAALEDLVSGHTPGQGHDTVGWPSFGYWPRYDSLTHEQAYYQWVERAWRGGLRLFTNLLVDNGQLCQVYPFKKHDCDEMNTVRLEAKRIRQLERYIDAQAGGPGRGFFRIITDPVQARAVANAGRLAVILGIEVSRPFGCREYLGTSSCTAADVDRGLTEVYNMGVRQMEMTNKFDNALTGVTGDDDTQGVIVNAGNFTETGHFWKMTACPGKPLTKDQHDKHEYNIADQSGGAIGRDALFGAVLQLSGASGAAPAYAGGALCNTIGLSDLGKAFLRGMVKRGMLFDPDHMSAIARQQSLDYMKQLHYSGIVSSHSWADDPNYFQILKMGGVDSPHAGGSASFLGKWAKLRTQADPRFLYGIGYGADINGFSTQAGPRNAPKGKAVSYPFTGMGGTRIDKPRTGTRTWDFNTEGLAHYGMYPDWVEDIKVQAGLQSAATRAQFTTDIENGAEAYLEMWERAQGVRGDSCRSDIADLTQADLKRVKPGMSANQVLAILGQPHTRVGDAFTYCGQHRTVTIDFTQGGALTKVS